MKNYKRHKIILFLFFIAFATSVYSQTIDTKDLAINKVFEKHAKTSSGSFAEMNMEVGNIAYSIKTLMVRDKPKIISFAKQCIEDDKQKATSVKEVYLAGKLTTISLKMPKKNGKYRFILLNDSEKGGVRKMTLIYLESENEEVLKIILKKK